MPRCSSAGAAGGADGAAGGAVMAGMSSSGERGMSGSAAPAGKQSIAAATQRCVILANVVISAPNEEISRTSWKVG